MRKLFIPVMLIASMTLNGCAREIDAFTEDTQRSISVETISPEIGNITVVSEYIGTMEPHQQVNVLPKLSGEVLEVMVQVGDTVTAGDILFTMNTKELENSIKSLEAALAAADAGVQAARTGVSLVDGSSMQSAVLSASGGVQQALLGVENAQQNADTALIAVEQREMGVEQAQMAYDLAAKSYNDTLALFEIEAVSKAVLDQAEMGRSNAKIALDTAKTALEQTKNSYEMAIRAVTQAEAGYEQALESHSIVTGVAPGESRRRAQDALEQAEAGRNNTAISLQQTKDRLEDAAVKAPISGIIESCNVKPYGMASPQAPAMVISNNNSMTVSFKIAKNSHGHIEIGDEITLIDGDTEYIGAITEIGTAVDMSGLFNVKATVSDPSGSLFSGAVVKILADAQKANDVLVLPLRTVHYESGIPYVYLAENGFAKKIQVQAGLFDAQNIEIISGIQNSDSVISTWNSRLSDGMEITVTKGRDE